MRAETAHPFEHRQLIRPASVQRGVRTIQRRSPDRRYSTACRHVRARWDERPNAYRRPRKADQQRQAEHSPAEISRDCSGAENINTLFDRIENAFIRPSRERQEGKSPRNNQPSVRRNPVKVRRMESRRPSRRCFRAETAHRRAKITADEGRQEARRRDCQNADDGQAMSMGPLQFYRRTAGSSSASNMSSGRVE